MPTEEPPRAPPGPAVTFKGWGEATVGEDGAPGAGAGLAGLLRELRSEYHEIQQAEMSMQRDRMKWLQSVERLLNSSQEALAMDGRASPSKPKHSRISSKWSQASLTPGTDAIVVLGPRNPSPQPTLPVPDPDKWQADSPRGSVGDFATGSWAAEEQGECDSLGRGGGGKRRPLSRLSQRGLEEARRISMAMDQYRRPAEKRLSESGKRRSRRDSVKEQTLIQRIVENQLFDGMCAAMILFSSIIVGLSVEHMTSHAEETLWHRWTSHVCSLFFLVELIMRMWGQGTRYWFGENRNWNMFDVALVIFSIVDFVLERVNGGGTTVASGMKVVKMLRIVRVFRVFRFFRELNLLALMIVDSTRSLVWAILMLAIIIYVFAIYFTSQATEHLKSQAGVQGDIPIARLSEVERQFGSLGKTVYSLVQTMMGGISWGVLCDALIGINWLAGVLFLFYVAFTILAVMNIITGVFVDNAVETARTQRDFLIQKEMELKEKYVHEMRDLFMEMDREGCGTIGLQDITECLEDPRVQGYFAALGLDPSDTERLFNLIDNDGSGDVDVGEFLEGCVRLKGNARSIDIYTLMHDMKSLENKVDIIAAEMMRDTGTHSAHKGASSRKSAAQPEVQRRRQVLTVMTTTATATIT
mmetsp:Transcript_101141/g.286625  ORF Transcript_101141/g.286625 Transcript_101141/m.286625 type:complete len:641 (-) Transcript_101141:106-2028(-)